MRGGLLARRRPAGVLAAAFWRLPLALLFELPDLALDEVALEHAQMLQEEDAVEVVNFMAEGAGQKIFAANLKRLALEILRLYGDEMGADDVATKTGDRQTAFFLAL